MGVDHGQRAGGRVGARRVPVHRPAGRPMWVAVIVGQLLAFVQAIIGVVLTTRYDYELDDMHALYGFSAIIAVGILYSYRTSPFMKGKDLLLYGFGSPLHHGPRNPQPVPVSELKRHTSSSGQLRPVEGVDGHLELGRELVAELVVVLADLGDRNAPAVDVDRQDRLQIGSSTSRPVVSSAPAAGSRPIAVSTASAAPLTRSNTHFRTRLFSP